MSNSQINQKYRAISLPEIDVLKHQGCTSGDWDLIQVCENFVPENIRNVQFSGNISVGDNSGTVEFVGGIVRNCGIYNASIHNCTIGDHVYIHHICNL